MKKGFTLIELLAVIVILGIVTVLIIISVIGVMNDSNSSLSNTQKNILEKAAEKWGTMNTDIMPYNDGDTYDLSVETLVNDGYIDSADLKNPKTGKKLCGVIRITYHADNNQYIYEFIQEDC